MGLDSTKRYASRHTQSGVLGLQGLTREACCGMDLGKSVSSSLGWLLLVPGMGLGSTRWRVHTQRDAEKQCARKSVLQRFAVVVGASPQGEATTSCIRC